ncbi:hypothetical protein AA105894_2199 [Asaia spathodeae NBRC 105894]|nr:hypothetical protein AA105894_2199 [Asaia spathodeae NBRC 105894]
MISFLRETLKSPIQASGWLQIEPASGSELSNGKFSVEAWRKVFTPEDVARDTSHAPGRVSHSKIGRVHLGYPVRMRYRRACAMVCLAVGFLSQNLNSAPRWKASGYIVAG